MPVRCTPCCHGNDLLSLDRRIGHPPRVKHSNKDISLLFEPPLSCFCPFSAQNCSFVYNPYHCPFGIPELWLNSLTIRQFYFARSMIVSTSQSVMATVLPKRLYPANFAQLFLLLVYAAIFFQMGSHSSETNSDTEIELTRSICTAGKEKSIAPFYKTSSSILEVSEEPNSNM